LDKDRGFHKSLLEAFKRKLFSFVPLPGSVFLGEVVEGTSKMREILNKASVKTSETEEGSNVFELGQGRPVLEALQFDGVHLDSSRM